MHVNSWFWMEVMKFEFLNVMALPVPRIVGYLQSTNIVERVLLHVPKAPRATRLYYLPPSSHFPFPCSLLELMFPSCTFVSRQVGRDLWRSIPRNIARLQLQYLLVFSSCTFVSRLVTVQPCDDPFREYDWASRLSLPFPTHSSENSFSGTNCTCMDQREYLMKHTEPTDHSCGYMPQQISYFQVALRLLAWSNKKLSSRSRRLV